MTSVSILGSTGSIGRNTLKVIEHLGNIRVSAMAAGRNMDLFARQVAEFKPELVSCDDAECADQLVKELRSLGAEIPQIELGKEGLVAVATHADAETVVSATVGAVGFVPTLRAIEAGKRIALANKETLVMAGELMTAAAARSGAELLPVDSEHNAIHQCLRGESRAEVRRIILTASGGPFRTKSKEEIAAASREEALNHPNWKMGEKITIDSATLMNKGLEVIEARWLFGFDADQIAVIVHPQSVIHSMVEYRDRSTLAQLGSPDMRIPIAHALAWPQRIATPCQPLDLARIGRLDFEAPDQDRFPALRLTREAAAAGGAMPAILNAANEAAVAAFLGGRIGFLDIAMIVEEVLNRYSAPTPSTIEDVLAADAGARAVAGDVMERLTV